jgi:polyisoprenyl-teichoic acid--peptidoglycan teichoic acid transferase
MRIFKFPLLFLSILVAVAFVASVVVYYRIPRITEPVSILILGKSGEGHTAPNLTDTIMVMFLNPETKKISFLSVPRDIWITEIRAKLNTAYHYGGFKMANDSIKSITGISSSNTVVVDFSLFKDVIDSIGGIKVDVENSFIDNKYPIEGKENDLCNGDTTYSCRYETLTFNAGTILMNGETALKFVRSRNAEGDEGTDLARSKRQQKVISAIQNKLLSVDSLFNADSLKKLYEVVVSHIETDMDQETALSLAMFIFESRDNINYISIPEDLIEVSQNDKKYDSQYVFLPKSGTWLQIQEWLSKSI